MNQSSFENAVSVFCDKYCRFPLECQSQDELDEHCDNCAFINLINRHQAEIENYKADKEEYIKDYKVLENSLKHSEQERKFEHQRVVHLQQDVEMLKKVQVLRFKAWLNEFAKKLKNDFLLVTPCSADLLNELNETVDECVETATVQFCNIASFTDLIKEVAWDYSTLECWYKDSLLNPNNPPVWTDEHLEELLNDFYVISKGDSKLKEMGCE